MDMSALALATKTVAEEKEALEEVNEEGPKPKITKPGRTAQRLATAEQELEAAEQAAADIKAAEQAKEQAEQARKAAKDESDKALGKRVKELRGRLEALKATDYQAAVELACTEAVKMATEVGALLTYRDQKCFLADKTLALVGWLAWPALKEVKDLLYAAWPNFSDKAPSAIREGLTELLNAQARYIRKQAKRKAQPPMARTTVSSSDNQRRGTPVLTPEQAWDWRERRKAAGERHHHQGKSSESRLYGNRRHRDD